MYCECCVQQFSCIRLSEAEYTAVGAGEPSSARMMRGLANIASYMHDYHADRFSTRVQGRTPCQQQQLLATVQLLLTLYIVSLELLRAVLTASLLTIGDVTTLRAVASAVGCPAPSTIAMTSTPFCCEECTGESLKNV